MEECYIYQTEKGGGQIAFMVNLIDQSLKVSRCIIMYIRHQENLSRLNSVLYIDNFQYIYIYGKNLFC